MRINNFIRFSESIKTREDMRVVSVTLSPLISDCTGTIGIYGLFSNEGEPIACRWKECAITICLDKFVSSPRTKSDK